MRIYSNKFELRTPTDRRYYAAPNSIFAFGVKATLDGEDAEGTIKVFQGSTELTPMEATVDGFKLYQRTSGSDTAVNEFDVVYTKDSTVQHFKLIENITDSTVFDIDQEGGAFELPIASSTVLGGIKVGQNLTIDADGTLNADAQELTPATTTNLGGVIVGSGLSVDTNGKLNATAGEETDPKFNSWLSSTGYVQIGQNAQAVDNQGYPFEGIAIGSNAKARNYSGLPDSIAIGAYAETQFDESGYAGNQLAIGYMAVAKGPGAIAIGGGAKASGTDAIQLGVSDWGQDCPENMFQVWGNKLLDKNTGKIPSDRLSAATTTTAGAVIVGSGLSVDTNGKISVTGGSSSFETWLSGDGIVAGNSATGEGGNSVAIGKNAESNGADSVALGYNSYVDGNGAVQLGQGVNETDNTLQFLGYTVIDGNGKVPAARMPVASTSTVGGVKVGQNLTVAADGTLNAQASYNAAIIVQPYRSQGEWYISEGQLKEQPFITSPYTDPIKNPPLYFINPGGSQTDIYTIIIVENGTEVRYECESESGMPLNYNGTPLFLLAYERGQLYFWGYNNALYAWGDPMPDGETLMNYTFKRSN